MSGHSGIYLSQKIGSPKSFGAAVAPDTTLRKARELNPELGGTRLASFAASLFQKIRVSAPSNPAQAIDTQSKGDQAFDSSENSFDRDVNRKR